MDLKQYIETVSKRYQSGISREHSYRADLEALIRAIVADVEITNEPANVTDCGNPDYVITRKHIPIGFIEAKDVGKDLNSKQYKPQFDRYRKALDNLIITDYIRFQFYQYGELVHEIRIADIEHEQIVSCPDRFAEFATLIQNFCTYTGQTIRSPKKLAGMMAAKARLLQIILEKAISSDEQTQDNTALQQQFKTFKDILIHDLTPAGFADIYAQTLAYGMFAARLNDQTLDTFSRQEAAELIPKSNPFLRKLFAHVAGVDIDDRIRVTVDNLADLFRATDIKALLKSFGRATQTHDPIIHFYETFLAEYNPKLRKARGVWYTPEPVVSFIVRGVDEILKTEFGLKDGLADTSTTTIKLKLPSSDKRKIVDGQRGYTEIEKEVHRVQVLDPATGTGTFLAEVVKFIYNGKFKAMQGVWSEYVDHHLIPRLNGFELLMASYAMAHLKLEMLLSDTGYTSTDSAKRLNIYLTNSLEEHHPDTGTLFSSWLSSEANEANHIKRDTPVMVVMGNPPYSGESANKGDWIMKLMEDYKKEPGGKEKLKERNPKWINDDYVKFIRYGQHFIEKNGEGILAFITPHGFLDNPTFRGMRWNLLKTYDKIYTIDLHGNSKKKETAPDGSKDVNVFDIMQGVAITFFVKKKPIHAVTPAKAGVQATPMDSRLRGNDEGLAEVHHFDLYGERKNKYDFLNENKLTDVGFKSFQPFEPNYVFKYQDQGLVKKYGGYFSAIEFFPVNVMGFQTHRDHFAVGWNKGEIDSRALDLRSGELSDDDIFNKYQIKDNRDWKLSHARKEITNDVTWGNKNTLCNYRPFDSRYSYLSYVMMDYPRTELINHTLNKDNILLGIGRQGMAVGAIEWCLATVSKHAIDANCFRRGGVNACPLYLYPEEDKQQNLGENLTRKPNLDPEIVESIAQGLDLAFEAEKSGDVGKFAPIDLLDYIYAVLHSPSYRETYKEFLKIDFPRIPYPKDAGVFWQLVQLGGELRACHLLESPAVEEYITSYPQGGDNAVTRKIVKKDWELCDEVTGRVWINDEQYFDQIPVTAWEFYIGGYQPAQKWLKDRSGRKLSYDDILHYQKIIVALTETDHLMQKIDRIGFE